MIQLIHAKQSQSPDCSFYTPLMMGPQMKRSVEPRFRKGRCDVKAPVFHVVLLTKLFKNYWYM